MGVGKKHAFLAFFGFFLGVQTFQVYKIPGLAKISVAKTSVANFYNKANLGVGMQTAIGCSKTPKNVICYTPISTHMLKISTPKHCYTCSDKCRFRNVPTLNGGYYSRV